MIYCFDIDNTICTTSQTDYSKSEPIQTRIDLINKLYDDGNTIIFSTGRAWAKLKLTEDQLKEWGVKYHVIDMGKPVADVYIDDKGMKDTDFFK